MALHTGRMLRVIPFFLLLLLSGTIRSQVRDSSDLSVRYYASFRGHLAAYDNELAMQENGSRIGFEITHHRRKVKYFAGAELGIQLLTGTSTFNVSARTSSGFFVLDQSQNGQLFAARTGYLGVDLGQWGVIKMGKQYGAYYDIAYYTDRFNVFGGTASNAYAAFSDGGDLGTGRANQAITYRNRWKKLQVCLQGQFGTKVKNRLLDGFGVSSEYEFAPGWKMGLSYNRSFIDTALIANVVGFRRSPEYLAGGIQYVGKRWILGLVGSQQTNGDLVQAKVNNENTSVVFDARGIECFARYEAKQAAVLFGYNGLYPVTDGLPLSTRFRREYLLLGGEYKPLRSVMVYGEGRLSLGEDSSGQPEFSVVVVGLRVDLNRYMNKRVVDRGLLDPE